MEEIFKQIRTVALGMWRYRWVSIAVAWLVAVIGVITIFRLPDQYEASARIYVDTQSILKPLMAGLTVQPNVEQQISMLSRTLISRPNLEKLIRMADVDLKTDSKIEQEALVERLTKNIQIRNTGRDNLYSLVYRDSEQDKAKRVVQSLVSIFVESSLGASRKDSDSAKTFLTEQIKQHEAKLEEAEARLKEFRIRNIEMQNPDGKDTASRLAEAAAQLKQAQLQLREAEDARNAAKTQLVAEEKPAVPIQQGAAASQPAPEPPPINVATPEIDARIDAQKRNLDSLLQRYTDQHPDVVMTRRLIKELQEQKAKEVVELRKVAAAQAAAAPPTAGVMGPAGNMVQQELSRMLAAAELQVASLKARVGEYQTRVAQVRESLKIAPQIDAEATQLNRDYGGLKRNYDTLVSRRQSAVMSGELEVASGVADFRLIDPPRVTPRPVAPNRLLLMPIPLLAALLAGLALAFVASQIRPVFIDPGDLRTKTGLPVLGVVSAVFSEMERHRQRMSLYRFIGASGALLMLFAVGLSVMAITGRG